MSSQKNLQKIKSSTLSLYEQPEQVLPLFVYIAVGYPQLAPLWWKVATARFFVLNGGILTDVMPALHLEPGWCAVHSILSRLFSARSVPCGWAYRPVWIDCKDTIP